MQAWLGEPPVLTTVSPVYVKIKNNAKYNVLSFLYGLNTRTYMADPNHNSNKEQTLCFEMPLLLQISTLLIFSLTNFNYNQ